jgi:hypothetical protein
MSVNMSLTAANTLENLPPNHKAMTDFVIWTSESRDMHHVISYRPPIRLKFASIGRPSTLANTLTNLRYSLLAKT